MTFNCPNAAKCGVCKFNGCEYETELEQKQRYVINLLGKFCRVAPIAAMESPLYYRNKVHVSFGLDSKGHLVCGNFRP